MKENHGYNICDAGLVRGGPLIIYRPIRSTITPPLVLKNHSPPFHRKTHLPARMHCPLAAVMERIDFA